MTVAVSGHPEIRRYEGPKGGVQKTVGSNEELIGPFRDPEGLFGNDRRWGKAELDQMCEFYLVIF